jgi:hypothetical protein
VDRHGIVQRTGQITEPIDGSVSHICILSEYWLGA